MTVADSAAANPTAIVLAEFSALRAEIAERSKAQHALITLNITAIGTLAGIVLANKVDVALLLLLPLLSPALGMLYLDHAVNITGIGRYIDLRLRPLLDVGRGNPAVLGYEGVVIEYERRLLPRLLLFGIPLFLIFAGAPIGALAATAVAVRTTATRVLWWIGLALVILYLVFWMLFMVRPHLMRRRLRDVQA